MKLFNFKKKSIPTGETVEIQTYERWSVRWESLKDNSGSGIICRERQEADFFLNEKDAELYRDQLRAAQLLLKQTYHTVITIVKED